MRSLCGCRLYAAECCWAACWVLLITCNSLAAGAHQWSMPQQGWLYVVNVDQSSKEADLLLIESHHGEIKGRINIGIAPDVALSPDGKYMYVVSSLGDNPGDTLSVLDLRSGEFLSSTAIQHFMRYTTGSSATALAVSPDGHWLFLLMTRSISRNHDVYSVAVFDTAKRTFLPSEGPVPTCGAAILLPFSTSSGLYVICIGSESTWSIIPRGTTIITDVGLSLRTESLAKGRVATAANVDGKPIVIYTTGEVVVVDKDKPELLSTRNNGRDVFLVPFVQPVVSGDKLFVATECCRHSATDVADSILSVDVSSPSTTRLIKLKQSFSNFAMSADGHFLYTVDSGHGEIGLFDVSNFNFRMLSRLTNAGGSPVRLFVVP